LAHYEKEQSLIKGS